MSTQVREKVQGDKVIQFSVFMENKVGRLLDIVRLLESADIHIIAISIIDTADCAIDRFVTDDPDRTRQLLNQEGLTHTETNLVVVEMGGATDLKKVLTALLQGECNLHFTYSLMIQPRGKPCLALHVEDEECASSVLKTNGFKILTQREISR